MPVVMPVERFTNLQQDLCHDQAEIGRQRGALEAERKAIIGERKLDSAIGSAAW